MRPLWKGAITFGLVNIPVKIFSAVKDSRLDLDMLDARDHSNIKFKRVNAETGKEVPYQQIVRAYSYHDKYVVLEQQDFESADAKKTNTIEILHFVKEEEIEPFYFEQPYYLEPEKSGVKAYGILREALAASGKVGVTTFVMRNKEALAVLKASGNVIILNRIRFEEEIKPISDLNLPPVAKAKSAEKEMAKKLIDELTVKFDIAKYKDTYTAKLLDIIKQKAKTGKSPKVPKLKVVHKKGDEDLMSMLKASLGGKRKLKKTG